MSLTALDVEVLFRGWNGELAAWHNLDETPFGCDLLVQIFQV